MWTNRSFILPGGDDKDFYKKPTYYCRIEVFDSQSIFGINGGQIAKLILWKVPYILNDPNDIKIIAYYRHEWILEPETDLDKEALQYILNIYK